MKRALPVLFLSILLLSGCAAAMLALEKKDLKMEIHNRNFLSKTMCNKATF